MDKIGIELALAAAKASGDSGTERMLRSAAEAANIDLRPRQGDSQPRFALGSFASKIDGAAMAGQDGASSLFGSILGRLFSARAEEVESESEGESVEGEEGNDGEEAVGTDGDMAGLAEMMSGGEQSCMVVIDGETGEIVGGGEGLPQEVLDAIKAIGLARAEADGDGGSGVDVDAEPEDDSSGGRDASARFELAFGDADSRTKH